MLEDAIVKILAPDKHKKLIVLTTQCVAETTRLRNLLKKYDYVIYEYTHVEEFRIMYEEDIKESQSQTAVVVLVDIYIPYDIRRAFHEVRLDANALFPNLNADVVMKHLRDWDIISFAVTRSYSEYTQAKQTERFISETVFSDQLITEYCHESTDRLRVACDAAKDYRDWMNVAKSKAAIQYYAASKNTSIDLAFADDAFLGFISDGYGRLSLEVNNEWPPIITKTIPLIAAAKNEKSALLVMDGMSIFDFYAIIRYFEGFEYEDGCTFALIPTTTPISRQSLLSGKYPRELTKPFSLSNEEKEFKSNAIALGYSPTQVAYLRGYDAEISPLSKLVAIIINDVDDISHGQRQGRTGMYNDMDLLGKSGKLQALIIKLTTLGYTVYITADHGNTVCIGVGSFRSGLEVESRSMRMVILKDFAKTNTLLTENTTEYQGYYLDKAYRYFICKNGISFDNSGEMVMTHGGMTLDEVVVPFVKIRHAPAQPMPHSQ